MNAAQLEQLKSDLLNGDILKHRRLLAAVGVFLIAFCAITVAGGYFLVTHAMDDNQVSSRSVNTPSQVSLLFEGYRPYQLINNIVFLNRVKLAPIPDRSSVYYAGEEPQKLLVVFHGSNAPAEYSVANVMGTLRPVNAELFKKWKLGKDEQKTIKEQGVYLDAESVKVQKSPNALARK
jgi:hypothetical protein